MRQVKTSAVKGWAKAQRQSRIVWIVQILRCGLWVVRARYIWLFAFFESRANTCVFETHAQV